MHLYRARANMKHGEGTYQYASGTKYDRQWFEDKKHGYGVMMNNSSKIRKGMWKDGAFIQSDL